MLARQEANQVVILCLYWRHGRCGVERENVPAAVP